jgi:hypothetical protein
MTIVTAGLAGPFLGANAGGIAGVGAGMVWTDGSHAGAFEGAAAARLVFVL